MAIQAITRDPGILDGAAIFDGTRVPVRTLTDYLESGETIDTFLDDFPTVRRESVVAFLQAAREQLAASA
jgi:uncharacterized protein (DUF433 family)